MYLLRIGILSCPGLKSVRLQSIATSISALHPGSSRSYVSSVNFYHNYYITIMPEAKTGLGFTMITTLAG